MFLTGFLLRSLVLRRTRRSLSLKAPERSLPLLLRILRPPPRLLPLRRFLLEAHTLKGLQFPWCLQLLTRLEFPLFLASILVSMLWGTSCFLPFCRRACSPIIGPLRYGIHFPLSSLWGYTALQRVQLPLHLPNVPLRLLRVPPSVAAFKTWPVLSRTCAKLCSHLVLV